MNVPEIDYAIDPDEGNNDAPDFSNTFTESGNTLTLHRSDGPPLTATLREHAPYHSIIFKAIIAGLTSDHFQNLGVATKDTYFRGIVNFIAWMNIDTDRNDINRFECLTDFEVYERNERKLKHSTVFKIKTLLGHTSRFRKLSNTEAKYIDALVRFTRRTYRTEYESSTVSDWFDIPWLKNFVGEARYLQLESPSRLSASLRVTAATTLQYLLDMRKTWLARQQPIVALPEKGWHSIWNCALLKSMGTFDSQGRPVDDITCLLVIDLVNSKFQEFLLERIREKGLANIGKLTGLHCNSEKVWKKPRFFIPPDIAKVSPAEERLASWLAAFETIPPSDIRALKGSNYACEYSGEGKKLKVMQSLYHKGRAGSSKRPQLLLGKHCWTSAMHDYIQYVGQGPLFKTDVTISAPLYSDEESNSFIGFLFRLWKHPPVKERIHKELDRHNASALFMEAMLALLHGSDAPSTFRARTGINFREDYVNAVPRPIPATLFTLGQIKTTSVHAASDRYRDSDLVNLNSHSSQTEKLSYLTDANKEYVNRFQRITRIVFHDLLNSVYRPSIDHQRRDVMDRESRTRIIAATGNENDETPSTLYIRPEKSGGDKDIIVVDCVDTAIQFLHYLSQAELHADALSEANPEFVEKTLLPNVEWMERTLARMSKTKEASKLYKKLSPHLAPEFSYILGEPT